MRVHDAAIPTDEFAVIQRHVPEACVELFLEQAGGVLLARRTNEPAKGEWFWPGGRLYKGEELQAAAHRVAEEELGLEVELNGRLGVYSHFWDSSAVEGVDTRHTVNVVFRVRPVAESFEIELDEQHDDVRLVSEPEGALHDYVQRYLIDAGYGAP